MSDTYLKISNQKLKLPAGDSRWKFTSRPGGWFIAERETVDGGVERHRFVLRESRARLSANVGGRLWQAEVLHVPRGAAETASGGDADLVAQFPGKVRKILVRAKDQVMAGDNLLLVEAMKMEFAVKAPFNGVVRELFVKEGQQLSPGDRFLDLEASAIGQ